MAGFASQRDEFDGSILRSLSLNDTSQFRTARNDSFMDDDMMEIDDVTEILEQTTNGKYHTPEPEPYYNNEYRDTSKAGITPLNKLGKFMMSPFLSTPKSEQMEEDVNSSDVSSNKTLEYNNTDDVEITPGYLDPTIDNSANQTYDSEASFSSAILSPTLLGARIAIGKPKLLLPAPEHGHRKDSFDFEYNTDSFSTSNRESSYEDKYDVFRSTPELRNRSKTKNGSSFFTNNSIGSFLLDNSDNNSTEEYIYNPAIQDYVNNDNNLQNNALHKSYMYKQQMENLRNGNSLQSNFYPSDVSYHSTPVQIHHHHYYNPSGNGNNSHLDLSTELHNKANTSMGFNSLVEARDNNSVSKIDYNLPLPWELNSSPHERVPYIISSYLQLIINFGTSFYAFYLITSMIKAVRKDIGNKLDQAASLTIATINECRNSYNANYCGTEQESSLVSRQCLHWYNCMNQNPNERGDVSLISAKTIGIIFNSLIEPLEVKFFLILFGFIFFVFLCNFTFGFIRAKSYYGWEETESNNKEANFTQME